MTVWAILILPAPVAHIWFLKSLPSRRIGLMLDMTVVKSERVFILKRYIVIEPGMTPLEEATLMTEEAYLRCRKNMVTKF